MPKIAWLILPLLMAALLPLAAQAQDLGALLDTEDTQPIIIEADQALEWLREDQAYVARGNALVQRGDMTLKADVLTAYYRQVATGGTEIWRVVATGGVHLHTPENDVYGARGVYDIDRQVAMLTGGDLRLEAASDRITARDSLEYWQTRQIAVARGDARAARNGNILSADKLTAFFDQTNTDDGAPLSLKEITAEGGVTITTATETARGEQARFDMQSNMARMEGNVRLTRAGSQMNGDVIEVDMTTGVSRLSSYAPESGTGSTGGGRVRGIFTPGQELPFQQPQTP